MAEAGAQGRQRAAELYRTYGPAVYRRCLKLLRDKEAARDATQEVFVKLVRDIAKLDDPAIVLPWCYRVATNHCLNVIRNRGRRGEEELDLQVADTAEPTSFPDRHLVSTILSHFDEGTRAVAVGVLVDGMGHEELASALGVSRKTVERRLARFLERARKLVDGDEP
ncbi:MAG TPA: sigma-70 family RNA polymerase sigma factor [Gemmatimonadales bacterium]